VSWIPEVPSPSRWEAGRGWSPSPWPRPGENEQAAHERWKSEWQAFQLDPAATKGTDETAQVTFARFLKERFAPALRDLGFKGSGSRYRLDRHPFQGGLSSQKSQYSNRAVVDFTINLWVRHLPTEQTFWGDRIGSIMPEAVDIWWRIPAAAALDALQIDVVGAVRDYAVVFFEMASNEREFPPDPERRWPLHFDLPEVHGDRGASMLDYLRLTRRPASPETAVELLSEGDANVRRAMLWHLYHGDPENPHIVPALVSVLQNDPNENDRSRAARGLGFVPSAPLTVVIPVLEQSAADDEKLEVRLSARYALAQLERRQVA
jgi:hypothetical protein